MSLLKMKTVTVKRIRPPQRSELKRSELALPYKNQQGFYNRRKAFFDVIVEQDSEDVSIFQIPSHNPSAEAEALRAAIRGLVHFSKAWTRPDEIDPDHKAIAPRIVIRPKVGHLEIELKSK